MSILDYISIRYEIFYRECFMRVMVAQKDVNQMKLSKKNRGTKITHDQKTARLI